MTIATYADLQLAVKDWANRMDSSVSARTADFIRLGEDRIYSTNPNLVVRSQWMIERATLTIPAGQNWCALPAGWLAFSRITLPGNPTQNNGGNVVEWMPPDMLEDLPTPGNANVYSIEGGRLLYGAVQDATGLAQDLNVKYFKHPGNLGSVLAPDTTFLLAQAPSIYLYAALVEAAIYVKKSDKIAEYGLLLDKAIEGFMSVEKAAQYSGSAIRFRRA